MPKSASALTTPPNPLLGSGIVVLAAASFTVSVILARLSYTAGSNATTILALRYSVAAILLYLYFKVRGQSPWLPRPLALRAAGIGLMVAVYAYGYLGAVQYIPVSLAVLIFYTYPLLTGLAAWLVDGEQLSTSKIAALGCGMIGVALAVEVSFKGLDLLGLGLAAIGSIGLAATIVTSQHAMRASGTLAVTFYINLVAAIAYLALGASTGSFTMPATTLGWLAFAALPLSFFIGITCFFGAVSMIGGVKTATIMNAEPVLTVIGAVFVLGETLAPLQMAGAALVLVAIFLVHRRD